MTLQYFHEYSRFFACNIFTSAFKLHQPEESRYVTNDQIAFHNT